MERVEGLADALGIRCTASASLADVDRRRCQLWLLSVLVGLAVPVGIVVLGLDAVPPSVAELLDLRTVRLFLLALLVAVFGYIAERERGLRQLTRLLVAERARVADLTQLDQLKDEFLTLVSHELRTPLTSVIGLAQTIETSGERLSREQITTLAGHVRREGWRLERLVGELLRTSQLAGAVPTLRPERVDVTEVVREVVDRLALGSDTHVLRVSVPDEPVLRAVDVDALHRVLVNLVGNALKYTPADSTVEVAVVPTDGGVVLTVDDEGMGVPEARREAMFEKFRRGDGLSSGGGLGLGLHLVRGLAVAHEGSATIQEAAGGGCRVRVVLGDLADRLPPVEPAYVAVGSRSSEMEFMQ